MEEEEGREGWGVSIQVDEESRGARERVCPVALEGRLVMEEGRRSTTGLSRPSATESKGRGGGAGSVW